MSISRSKPGAISPHSPVPKRKGGTIRRSESAKPEEFIPASLLPDDGTASQTIIITTQRKPSRLLMVPHAIVVIGLVFFLGGIIATFFQLFLVATWIDSFFLAKDEWSQALFSTRIGWFSVRGLLGWIPAILVQTIVTSPGFFTADTALFILYGEETTAPEAEHEENWSGYIFFTQIGALFFNVVANFFLLGRLTDGSWQALMLMGGLGAIIPLAALLMFPIGIRICTFGVKRLLFNQSLQRNQRQSDDYEDAEEVIELR